MQGTPLVLSEKLCTWASWGAAAIHDFAMKVPGIWHQIWTTVIRFKNRRDWDCI